MPKRAQEEYEADDGFVEDAPQSKKSKKGAVKKTEPKSPPSTGMLKDKDGNEYWVVCSLPACTRPAGFH
jgi:hypothetical protein